jgi:biopolymer transport protein TolR
MSLERPRIRPEINVTPLVDVVLVLLIICMVITPQMEGPAVDLATAKNSDADEKKKLDTLIIVLNATGGLFLGQDAVTSDTLPERLAEARRRQPEARVVIKADRAAPFGQVRALYAVCQKLGLTSVSLKVGDAGAKTAGGT